MYITITSLRLKSLWKFFALSYSGLQILKQTRSEKGFVEMRNTGFGYMHYTLSVWETGGDLKRFVRSGAHLEAMKTGGKIATEVRTYTYKTSSGQIPAWKEARDLVRNNGKVFTMR